MENWRQAFGWGEYRVLLYKKYCHLGMPKCTWKDGITGWTKLARRFIRTVPHMRSRRDLLPWCWAIGGKMGRLKGSIKYRTLSM